MDRISFSIDIPEAKTLETLLRKHEQLIGDLRSNLRDINAVCLEVEMKMNQPAVAVPADSESEIK